MESLDSFDACLKNLHHQAGVLAGVAVSLGESFKAEADRLKREDAAQRLKAIHAAIALGLEWSRQTEGVARHEYTRANLIFSLTGLAAKIVLTATTKNQLASNLVDYVFGTDAHEKRPFGTVMVCVGPEGLPGDARVVSISELARESNRPEGEIIQKLRKSGYLLFNQEAFSSLIDRLVIDVREGRLDLPISSEQVSEIGTSATQGIRCVARNDVSKK